MTTANMAEAFRAIEKDPGLSNTTRFLGQSFYVSIKDAYCHQAYSTGDKITLIDYRGLLALFFLSILTVIRMKKAGAIFFSADSGLSMGDDGIINDKYSVFLDADKAWHCIAVSSLRELPTAYELYRANIIADNILLMPFNLLLRPIFSAIVRCFLKKKVFELCNLFNGHGLILEPDWVRAVVARDFVRYVCYKAFIRIAGAKTVYLVSASGRSFIVNAARSLNAVCIEIQHGICGPIHRGFNYQCSPEIIAAPDFLLVWNEYWRNEAISGGFFNTSQVKIARPPGSDCRGCAIGDRLPCVATSIAKRYIVFTGQPVVVGQICSQIEEIYPSLIQKDLYFVYKFHPGDSEQTIKELTLRWAQHNRIILIDQPICMKCLLRHADAHCSFWSTCHHDAVEILGKTFVLAMPDINHMEYYCTAYPQKFVQVNSLAVVIDEIFKSE